MLKTCAAHVKPERLSWPRFKGASSGRSTFSLNTADEHTRITSAPESILRSLLQSEFVEDFAIQDALTPRERSTAPRPVRWRFGA